MIKIYQQISDLGDRINSIDDKIMNVIHVMVEFENYDDMSELKADIRGAIHDLQEIRKELY